MKSLHTDQLRFETTFSPKELTPRDVTLAISSIQDAFDMVVLHSIELKFIITSSKTTKTISKYHDFAKMYESRRADLRGFCASLVSFEWLNRPLFSSPRIELRQRVRTKPGSAKLQLSMRCFDIREECFDECVQLVASTLGLELVPPVGATWDLVRFERLWLSKFSDSELQQHITGSLAARQFDSAIRAAISVVECRLRDRCIRVGRTEARDQSGVDLVITAYHKDKGCLVPPWPTATEASHGAQLFFQGFFLYIRNAFAHNAEVMGSDGYAVCELLHTCEFLLRVIDRSVPRIRGD